MSQKKLQISVEQVSQLSVILNDPVSSVLSEIKEKDYTLTPDQKSFAEAIRQHFARIQTVLSKIGTGERQNGAEWESAEAWGEIYLSLFLLIDAGHKYIKKHPGLEKTTPSELMGLICSGHAFFWLEKCFTDYRFSVKKFLTAYRRVAKLQHLNCNYKDDRQIWDDSEPAILDDLKGRLPFDNYFAVHALCLFTCETAAHENKSDFVLNQRLRDYRSVIGEYGKRSTRSLKGGRGFGFQSGKLVVPTGSAGTWKEKPLAVS